MAVDVSSGFKDLLYLLECVNQVCKSFNLPQFYKVSIWISLTFIYALNRLINLKDCRFHVSLFSAPDKLIHSALLTETTLNNNETTIKSGADNNEISKDTEVDKLFIKSGNKKFTIQLQ
jgi:hypothetical protein